MGYKWGQPVIEYSDVNALLQLCDDFESDFESDPLVKQFQYLLSSEDLDTHEGKAFWGDLQNPDEKEVVRRITEDLNDRSYIRPAWKKSRNILSPDIETQKFMGDIMMSNTYMTTRVPANWFDEEYVFTSDTLLVCNTLPTL